MADHIGTFPSVAALPTKAVKAGTRATVNGTDYRWGGEWELASNAQSDVLIGDLGSALTGTTPVAVTTDSGVSYVMGPTTNDGSNTEYATLKTNRIEYCFVGPNGTIANTDKLHVCGTVAPINPWQESVHLQSGPWPYPNGSMDWWNRGAVEFYADGTGSVSVAWTGYQTFSANVLVDGQRFSDSDTAGLVSSSVSTPNGQKRWVTLTFTTDRRRLITIRPDGGNVYSIVRSGSVTISRPDYLGKALVCSDSFGTRYWSTGGIDKGQTIYALATTTMRILGYDAIEAGAGGTGFQQENLDARVGSYNRAINAIRDRGDVDLAAYKAIFLFGTGNDSDDVHTVEDYASVIRNALSTFPCADVWCSSVYESYTVPEDRVRLNALMVQAVAQCGPRVHFVPIDSVYKWDRVGVWSGTGSAAAPAYDGNADIYFSGYGQSAGDRHPNSYGVAFGAKFYAAELIRAGIKYRKW